MSESEFLFTSILIVIMVVSGIGALVFKIWRDRLLPKELAKKYPFSTLAQCKFPFFRNWEITIDKNDIPIFKKYREVTLLYYKFNVVIIVLGVLLFIPIWT